MYPTNNLQPGSTGNEVKKLQEYLVQRGFLSLSDYQTGPGTYGLKTTAAVRKLQESLGIDNSSGPGYWGPKTISAVQTQATPTPRFQTNKIASLAVEPKTVTPVAITPTPATLPTQIVQDVQTPTLAPVQQPQSVAIQTQAPMTLATPPQTPSSNSYGLTGEYAQMYDMMKQYLDKLTASGQSINPNIDISPERVSEFMAQAQSNLDEFLPYAAKEIKPYFENQLKVAREGFLRGLGYTAEQLVQHEANLEQQFTETQRQIGEQSAETGFAQSGMRQQQEQQTVDETQRAIDTARGQTMQKATDLASGFAQDFGTENTPRFNIGAAPKVGQGGFTRAEEQQQLYQLSPDVYEGLKGTKQFEQESATRKRAAELELAFRSQSATNQLRNLTF